MKERPILMNGAMVRATLREVDPKRQTRRILKAPGWDPNKLDLLTVAEHPDCPKAQAFFGDGFGVGCPYGKRSDRLWVRETWGYARVINTATLAERSQLVYRATYPHADGFGVEEWRPSIHMKRADSRINLEITGIKVERVQDISEEDARAEGVEALESDRAQGIIEERDEAVCRECGGTRLTRGLGQNLGVIFDVDCTECDTYRKRFRNLWRHINGPESWDANPYVWALTFKLLQPGLGGAEG